MKKNYFLSTVLIIVFVLAYTGIHINKEKVDIESESISTMSQRVDVQNYVPIDDVVDGYEDDDAIIIYSGDSSTGSDFDVQEFLEYDNMPSDETMSKIETIHIPELQKIRNKIGEPIIIRSASRSYAHEISRGRTGKSQHVYSNGKGAVDISLNDFSKKN